MYKTVNGLAQKRLCEVIQNVNAIYNYELRDSSTKHIQRPLLKAPKSGYGIVGPNYRTRYRKG